MTTPPPHLRKAKKARSTLMPKLEDHQGFKQAQETIEKPKAWKIYS